MAGPYSRHTSWLVPTFAIVNLGVFVLEMYLNDCPSKNKDCLGADKIGRFSFQNTKENPLLGPSPATLVRMGGLDVTRVLTNHQYWRMFTCMWLHGGLVHVLLNVISLLLVGVGLEHEFGFFRIGLLYIIAGIGGNLLSGMFVRTSVSVGASGALFGLLGGMLSELLTNWSTYSNKCIQLTTLILVISLNLAIGILPIVNNFAHIGGFVTGFFLGFVLLLRPQYAYMRQKYAPPGYYGGQAKSKYKCCQCFMLFFSLLVIIAGLVIGFYLFVRNVDGNEHCSWCHYLKCVPTPFWECNENGNLKRPDYGILTRPLCESTITGDQLTMKCFSNGKISLYTLLGNKSESHLRELCSQTCS